MESSGTDDHRHHHTAGKVATKLQPFSSPSSSLPSLLFGKYDVSNNNVDDKEKKKVAAHPVYQSASTAIYFSRLCPKVLRHHRQAQQQQQGKQILHQPKQRNQDDEQRKIVAEVVDEYETDIDHLFDSSSSTTTASSFSSFSSSRKNKNNDHNDHNDQSTGMTTATVVSAATKSKDNWLPVALKFFRYKKDFKTEQQARWILRRQKEKDDDDDEEKEEEAKEKHQQRERVENNNLSSNHSRTKKKRKKSHQRMKKRFDKKYVLDVYEYYDGDENPNVVSAMKEYFQSLAPSPASSASAPLFPFPYRYCIVMEQGELNLCQALKHERDLLATTTTTTMITTTNRQHQTNDDVVGGNYIINNNISTSSRDDQQQQQQQQHVHHDHHEYNVWWVTLQELGECLRHIHSKKYIHGDFQPINCVQQTNDRQWNICDFDLSICFGQPIKIPTIRNNWKEQQGHVNKSSSSTTEDDVDDDDGKFPDWKFSASYMPPEMAKEVVSRMSSTSSSSKQPEEATTINVVAHPSYDVWSFGMVMFELVTGESFFGFDEEEEKDDDDADHDGMTKNKYNKKEEDQQRRRIRKRKKQQISIVKKLSKWTDEKTIAMFDEYIISNLAKDLLLCILKVNPYERISIKEILHHEYFTSTTTTTTSASIMTTSMTSTSTIATSSAAAAAAAAAYLSSLSYGNDASQELPELSSPPSAGPSSSEKGDVGRVQVENVKGTGMSTSSSSSFEAFRSRLPDDDGDEDDSEEKDDDDDDVRPEGHHHHRHDGNDGTKKNRRWRAVLGLFKATKKGEKKSSQQQKQLKRTELNDKEKEEHGVEHQKEKKSKRKSLVTPRRSSDNIPLRQQQQQQEQDEEQQEVVDAYRRQSSIMTASINNTTSTAADAVRKEFMEVASDNDRNDRDVDNNDNDTGQRNVVVSDDDSDDKKKDDNVTTHVYDTTWVRLKEKETEEQQNGQQQQQQTPHLLSLAPSVSTDEEGLSKSTASPSLPGSASLYLDMSARATLGPRVIIRPPLSLLSPRRQQQQEQQRLRVPSPPLLPQFPSSSLEELELLVPAPADEVTVEENGAAGAGAEPTHMTNNPSSSSSKHNFNIPLGFDQGNGHDHHRHHYNDIDNDFKRFSADNDSDSDDDDDESLFSIRGPEEWSSCSGVSSLNTDASAGSMGFEALGDVDGMEYRPPETRTRRRRRSHNRYHDHHHWQQEERHRQERTSNSWISPLIESPNDQYYDQPEQQQQQRRQQTMIGSPGRMLSAGLLGLNPVSSTSSPALARHPSRNDLEELIEAGDWAAVGDTAALLADSSKEGSESTSSERTGASTSPSSSSSSSSNSHARAQTPGGSADQAIRYKIENLIRQVVPEEIRNIDILLVQYRGREEKLISILEAFQEHDVVYNKKEMLQQGYYYQQEVKQQEKKKKKTAVNNSWAVGKYVYRGGKVDIDEREAITYIQVAPFVNEIEDGAFEECESLVRIEFPTKPTKPLTRIGKHAFLRCRALTTIELPNSVKEIADGAFRGCTGLTCLVIPDSTLGIGRGTFRGCSALSTILLPNSLKQIKEKAFYKCNNLTTIEIPKGTHVGQQHTETFSGCNKLERASSRSTGTRNIESWLRHRFDDKLYLHRCCYRGIVTLENTTSKNQDMTPFETVDLAEMTPLHVLACSPNISLDGVRLLLSKAENSKKDLLSAIDLFGRTALHYACQNPFASHDVIHMLAHDDNDDTRRQNGTNLFCQKDVDYKFPTTLAIEVGQPTSIQQWLFSRQPVGAGELGRLPREEASNITNELSKSYLKSVIGKDYWTARTTSLSKVEQHGWVSFVSSDVISNDDILSTIEDFIVTSDASIVEILAYAEDDEGRPAIVRCVKRIRNCFHRALLFYGKYQLEEDPKYESPTCKVYFTQVVEAKNPRKNNMSSSRPQQEEQRQQQGTKPVALKFFYEKSHFESELNARLFDPSDIDDCRFHSDYIIDALDYHDGDIDDDFAQAAAKRFLPRYCIVLTLGERNLCEVLGAENLVRNEDKARIVLQELLDCLRHMKSKNCIHGDFKPRNCVRKMNDRKWCLIDFDATVEVGQPVGGKVSSAYMPPEMVKIIKVGGKNMPTILYRGNANIGTKDVQRAKTSFDVWSFGITMFQVLSGQHFFDRVNVRDSLNEAGLRQLARWTDSDTELRLETEKDVFSNTAKDLLRKILRVQHEKRLSLDQIHKHPFFSAAAASSSTSTTDVISASHQQIQKTLDEIRMGQSSNHEQVLEAIQTTNDVVQRGLADLSMKIDDMNTKFSNMIETIGRGEDAPRYCFIIIPEMIMSTDDDGGGGGSRWKQFFKSSMSFRVKVCFVCPVLKDVPRNDDKKNGEASGYTLTFSRQWVKEYGTAILYGLRFIQLGLAAGRLVGLPLPSLSNGGSLEDQMSELIEMHDHISDTLEGNEMIGGIATAVENAMATAEEQESTIRRPSSTLVTEHSTELRRLSYEAVRRIATAANDPTFERCGLVRAQHTNKDGSTLVDYVDPSVKALFEKKGRACFHMTPIEIFKAATQANAEQSNAQAQEFNKLKRGMVEKNPVIHHAYLERQYKSTSSWRRSVTWKRRYFVLYKDGLFKYFKNKTQFEKNPTMQGNVKPTIRQVKLVPVDHHQRAAAPGRFMTSAKTSSTTGNPTAVSFHMHLIFEREEHNEILRSTTNRVEDLALWKTRIENVLGTSTSGTTATTTNVVAPNSSIS